MSWSLWVGKEFPDTRQNERKMKFISNAHLGFFLFFLFFFSFVLGKPELAVICGVGETGKNKVKLKG